MKIKTLQILTAVIVFLMAGQIFAEMTDPYEILNKSYEAIGGLGFKSRPRKPVMPKGRLILSEPDWKEHSKTGHRCHYGTVRKSI